MRAPKKPPPDTVANVLGRIRQLKIAARGHARMAAKEGGDYDRALAKAMKDFEPRFKKLRARLEKCRKGAPKPGPEKKAVRSATKPVTKSKKRSAARVPADYDDLLATLGDL